MVSFPQRYFIDILSYTYILAQGAVLALFTFHSRTLPGALTTISSWCGAVAQTLATTVGGPV